MGSNGPLKAIEALAWARNARAKPAARARQQPPFRRKVLFESLEKRFLLAAELAIIPPQDIAPPPVPVAPVQVDAGFDLAAAAEVKLPDALVSAQTSDPTSIST